MEGKDKKDQNPPLLTVELQAGEEELLGRLEFVLFHNENNGYSVVRISPDDKKQSSFVAVGNIHSPQVGIGLRLLGGWIEHARFGRQFSFSYYEVLMPATLEGIKHYLGSGLIKGVRERMAIRITSHFGEETIRILDEEPERLSEVKGLSQKTVTAIKGAWSEHQGIRSLIMFLQPHGVSTAYAVRIFKHYGGGSLEIVQENPYRLAMDIHGIGFITSDAIAKKIGVPHDSPLRAEAGVLYTLKKLNDEGHVFYPLEYLADKSSVDLDIPHELVLRAIKRLEAEERVVVEELYDAKGFCFEGVYLSLNYHYESKISHYLHRIINSPKSVGFYNFDEELEQGLKKIDLELGFDQIEAVRSGMKNKVMVITGGPGTGKTTVINAIIKIYLPKKHKILLAAPTGRAAKRMSETSGMESKTIHRLLEFSPNEDGFVRNENNPLACGLLVIDEASMLDTMLMYHLLKATPLGATIIFVGDINQLPSVGAGNVLQDIMGSNTVSVVELTEIFRQAAESDIILNAHRINQGQLPIFRDNDDKLRDFYFIRQDDPEACAQIVVDLVCKHIPRRFKLNPVDDVQVLTPMHKGEGGSIALNARLQAVLNRETSFIGRGERLFRLGDKVMQIRNNYDKEVFNGDIGRVCYLDKDEKELTVRFEERNVLYSSEELDELVQAYAISVHKAQGSEYPAVVMPLLNQHYMLLQRNLLYTAVTRGKVLVIVVGSLKALQMAVGNNKTYKRYTWLKERLAGSQKKTPLLDF